MNLLFLGGWRTEDNSSPLLAPAGDGLRAENFALGVLLTHSGELTPAEFDHFLKICCARGDCVPTSKARTLLATCLSRSYDADKLTMLLTWASQGDYKGFVPFILEKRVALGFLAKMESRDRSAIFGELLDFWGSPEEIAAAIAENRREIRSLLRWAIDQEDAAVCQSSRLTTTLAHVVGRSLQQSHDSAEVGQMLFCLCFAGACLPDDISETIPMEWLKELRTLRGSEAFLASTLLTRMEQCDDTNLRERFPDVWCPVWGNLEAEACHRAVAVVARWCKLAGPDADGAAFAIRVLRNLPLHALSGPSLDIVYSPELPVQAGTIYVVQLLQQNRKEDREELQRFVDESNRRFASTRQELSRVSEAASDALQMAEDATRRADRAADAARRAQTEAEKANKKARRNERGADFD